MAKTHKNQHWVPQTYLAGWCDPNTPKHMEPYVWKFPREGGAGKRKAPENLFFEKDMYTVHMPDGERDLTFEKGLSQIERGFAEIRDGFIERRRQIPTARFLRFIAFIAVLKTRTRRFRDHHKAQWQKVLDLGEEMEKKMAEKSPEERERIANLSLPPSGPSMTMEDVRIARNNAVQVAMPEALGPHVRILSQMEMTVFCTEASPGFITSDDPVAWFDPEANQRPLALRSPGLLFDTIEVTMPLSPSRFLAIRHAKPITGGVKPIEYLDVPDEMVGLVNRRTALHADETVVACKDHFECASDDWENQ